MSCDRDERVCVRLQSTLVEFPVSVQWPVCNVEQIVTYTAVGPCSAPPTYSPATWRLRLPARAHCVAWWDRYAHEFAANCYEGPRVM